MRTVRAGVWGAMVVVFLAGAVTARSRAEDSGPATGFTLDSGHADLDQAYQKARKVLAADVKNGSFIAGANWDQVWTRDTSYSVDLACALLLPDVSKTTLMGLREDVPGIGECWYQDKCGHFAGWPNLTDAIVGASGAWSLYRVTGDESLLRPVYERTVHSLKRAERDNFRSELGLFGGCSTFMESNSGYPKKFAMNGPLLAKSHALSTNLLYYRGYIVAARIGQKIGEESQAYQEKADKLKAAINQRLWLPEKGYYAYYLDENGKADDRMEGTGEAFAILYRVADNAQARSILKAVPVTPWGIPCLWPPYPEWKDYKRDFAHYYHNGMIWPFVQGYWAWAASRVGDEKVFGRELDGLIRLSQKNDTFMEFYRPEDGKPDGSPRQLWSASGFLSMVFHGLCGMSFQEEGIRFAPVVPEPYDRLSLKDVHYRGAVLDIEVTGRGSRVERFQLDGERKDRPFLDGSLKGKHRIEIRMSSAAEAGSR